MIPILLSATGNVCFELGDTDDDHMPGWLAYDSTLAYSGPLWDVLDGRITEFCNPYDQYQLGRYENECGD